MTCGAHEILVNNGIKIGWDPATRMRGEIGGGWGVGGGGGLN